MKINNKILMFGILFLLVSSSYVYAQQESFSIFSWIKNFFQKPNYGGTPFPLNNNQQFSNPNANYLYTLQNKCVLTDRIVNYCNQYINYGNGRSIIINNIDGWEGLVSGNSMLPLIRQNDIILLQKINSDDNLYSCEIVKAKAPSNYNIPYVWHRVLGWDNEGYIILHGDNNPNTIYERVKKGDILDRLCGVLK